ncbi:MAG: DUF4178 domain-containing protein [Luteolibacter sp.]
MFAVCAHCRSMVVRRDVELEAIGTMAELPPDSSPLQIGAVGAHGSHRFRLLGRLRLAWKDGTWSEWYADFGEGRNGWVAESQGFFYISETAPAPANLAELAKVTKSGKTLKIGGAEYTVTDIKDVRVTAAEGELPFVGSPGETWRGIDLTGDGRMFAGVELADNTARLYLGSTALPEEIQWQGLRAVPGWNGEPVPTTRNQTEALNCPECGGVIEQKLKGESSTLSCIHCGTILDIKGPKAVCAQKVRASDRVAKPIIPLGRRGTLHGVEWEVLGCLKRDDGWSGWFEFLLHNPWCGFAWLTESKGHWNFVRRLLDEPTGLSQEPRLRGTTYKLFSSGNVKVSQVAGEFYWRVRVGEKASTMDFVAPPRILSYESYPELEETAWSEGEYLPQEEIRKAFGIKNLLAPGGVFLNQPNPWAVRWPGLRKIAGMALAIALVVEFLSGISSVRHKVLDQDFEFKRPADASAAIAPLVTPSFELTGSQKPATVGVEAGVDNAWLGMEAELVNEQTGMVYPTDVTVEFYHGYDDGEWTEGGRDQSSDLPAVPPGRYHLALTPEADPSIASMPFHVSVSHGGLFWSNFVICLIALGAWPAWSFFRYHRFEAKRWSESDHSPYPSLESE